MKTKNLLHLPLFVVLLIAVLSVQPVFAHGDEPRIEISADSLNPGDVLDIRGVDFEFEEVVDLLLVGPQAEVPFGTVLADTEGVFLLTVTLPMDITEGTYVMRATTDDHVVESPQITVWGTADLGGGEEGPREEDDGLLAPMPTAAPVVPTAQPAAASPVESTSPETGSIPLVWIAAGIGVVLLLGLVVRARK